MIWKLWEIMISGGSLCRRLLSFEYLLPLVGLLLLVLLQVLLPVCRRRNASSNKTAAVAVAVSAEKEPDTTKMTAVTKNRSSSGTVDVFILLGQSNMLGMGHIHGDEDGSLEYAVQNKHLYSYLVEDDTTTNNDDEDDGGGGGDGKRQIHWKTSPNVRNVRVMPFHGKMRVYHNEFMTVRGETIGPELGIGHSLEQYQKQQQPVMLLKSCIGNRSLGWDLLPPNSPRITYDGKTYAGYKEHPESWPEGEAKPDDPNSKWYAGKQYDDDIADAKQVLEELDRYYPDRSNYQVKGFFWWQGDKDRYCKAYAANYESNLVRLIHQLRKDFHAPHAPFVLATLGQAEKKNPNKFNSDGSHVPTASNCPISKYATDQMLLEAMLAVDGKAGKYADFAGNVATVYSHPLSKGGASNSHYNGNAETYMNIGQAMGSAMVELLHSQQADQQHRQGQQQMGETLV